MRPNASRMIDLVPIAIMFLSTCRLFGLAYAGNDKPATRPISAEEVARWVAGLGADDPERASRAAALLARLDRAPSSLTEREMLEVIAALSGGGSRRLESAKVVDGGVCELSVQGEDARVVMRCDAKGIVVRVEYRVDAKDQSSELRARDAAELKKRYPEAAEFYHWTTRNMGRPRRGDAGMVRAIPGTGRVTQSPRDPESIGRTPVVVPTIAALRSTIGAMTREEKLASRGGDVDALEACEVTGARGRPVRCPALSLKVHTRFR